MTASLSVAYIHPPIHKTTLTTMLTGYNVKTREKNVPILNATMTRTKRGTFLVRGDDGQGNKMTTLVNQEQADAALRNKWATLKEQEASK